MFYVIESDSVGCTMMLHVIESDSVGFCQIIQKYVTSHFRLCTRVFEVREFDIHVVAVDPVRWSICIAIQCQNAGASQCEIVVENRTSFRKRPEKDNVTDSSL